MNQRLENSLSILLTVAAVVMAASIAYKAFGVPASVAERGPELVSNWEALRTGGVLVGADGAPVEIVEFVDFECPFCQISHVDVTRVREEFPDDVSVRYYHFPLSRVHRFADVSAHAAECAREQGKFEEMARLMFAMQDSFGLKSWTSFADEAQVPDTAAFARCQSSRRHVPTIEDHRELARRMGLEGTPTMIIDGWQLPFAPPADTLRAYVETLLQGDELPFAR